MKRIRASCQLHCARGFTLIEVMIAATLVLLVFFGLAQVYALGRRQINLEESRRKATMLVQARLEGIRRDYQFDTLGTLGAADGTVVVDNRSFQISHTAALLGTGEQAAAVTVTVTWLAPVGEGVYRSVDGTTILARSLP